MKRALLLLAIGVATAACGADRVSFTRQRLFPGFDGKTCKIQPSVATDGEGTVLLTWQNLLVTGCDVFYGESMARSTDGGRTFSPGVPQSLLKDTWDGKIRTARYANVYYSKRNRRWFGLGAGQLYANDREPLLGMHDGKPSLYPIYYTVDPQKGEYVAMKRLDVPFAYSRALPFGQVVEEEDGQMLVPFYVFPPGDAKKGYCQVVRYRFTADGLEPVTAGTPIVDDSYPRGIVEPSLAKLGGKYYITLRTDVQGLWAVSDDGLTFAKPQAWRWDDGSLLENANTQQHWMRPQGALYLAYTRRTPHNGHVFRHRAPIFMAKFDPARGCLVRATEVVLVPELGARLGNFNAIDPADDEAWLVTAEWMQSWDGRPETCMKYGSDNSLWLAKVKFQVEDSAKARGTLCLTFDDRNFDSWRKALPLFEKYGARATFFICGKIDGPAYGMMNVLRRKGHSIGFHGVNHAKAPELLRKLGPEGYFREEIKPQLDAARAEGYVVRNFGYPYSTHDAETEKVLAPHFDRRRSGCIFGRDPAKLALADCDEIYCPQAEFAKLSLFKGTGLGSKYDGMEADVERAVKRLADRGEAMVLYSHAIVSDGSRSPNNISLQTLESLLRAAKEHGVRVIGFDEIGK